MVKFKQKKWKLKLISAFAILIFYYVKKNLFVYLLSIIDYSSINEFKLYVNQYSHFNSFDPQISLLSQYRRKVFKLLLKKNVNKNATNFNSIFIDVDFRFGNLIAFLNKVLFYCEIIGCKYFILNKDKFWFINDTINIKYKNITIKKGNYSFHNNSMVLYHKPWKIYRSNFYNIKPPIRIHFLRQQIINNLPKVKINREDLVVHIRSGNVFKNYFHNKYAQPPLCFYINILKKFKFNNVSLISKDDYNPIVKKLINKFSHVSFIKSDLQRDVSILLNAFNIVGSISSFLISILQLNYNLEYFWDFNMYKISEKINHFHFDFNKLPHNNFTVFRMEPSLSYKNKMFNWKHSKSQLKLMIKDKCINEFSIIKKEN